MRLVFAPSNLGLMPPAPGQEPGTWRGPEALAQSGLCDKLSFDKLVELDRPHYSPDPEQGTRIRNASAMRAFNLHLADQVHEALRSKQFPLVIGGDCSILLGCLAGARRAGPVGLFHIDGHGDFRHPGNHDFKDRLGSVAGMDLALATGRGEALMSDWPNVSSPLVPDHAVVQLGEREIRDPDYEWPDIIETGIRVIDVFDAQHMGSEKVLETAMTVFNRQADWPVWIHLDIDVMDQIVMPAVDTPGSPGLSQAFLETICRGMLDHHPCAGMSFTIYDPDLDKHGDCAALIVDLLASIFENGA